MKCSAARIDITPEIHLPIGGNIREDNLSRGVHDRLYCNAILLKSNEEPVCFLAFDLLGLSYDQCSYIKAEVAKTTGLSVKNIVVSAVHTHSGPDVTGIFRDSIDEGCVQYFNEIVKKIALEVKCQLQKQEEVKIGVSKKAVCDLSFNRRLIMKDGSMKMNWEDINPEDFVKEAGPIDPELNVVAIYNQADKIKAVMVNFTLHPAILVGKDWLWSRDYINYLDNYIKAKLGYDVVVFFANGSEGNINHLNWRDKNQSRGFEEAERIGEALGKNILELINTSALIENESLSCVSKIIRLPLRMIPQEDIKKAEELLSKCGDKITSLLDGVPDEVYAREVIKLSKIKDRYVETEIQAISIGDTAIATLPGEVFVEFGLKIKQLSGFKNTLVFGLANDFIGYIPTQIAFEEGGYEIKTAASSKLDKTAGDQLVKEVVELLGAL